MDIRIETPTIAVHPRLLVRLQVGAGHHLTNVRGTTWITVDGEPDDVILEPGDTHTFERPGRVIVQALGGEAELVAEEGIEVDGNRRGTPAPSFGAKSVLGSLRAAANFLRRQS